MLTALKMRLVRRVLILGLLLAGLSVVSAMPPTKVAATCLICCSACDADPPPLPCRHGCSPSC
jgi:hypothetical protein